MVAQGAQKQTAQNVALVENMKTCPASREVAALIQTKEWKAVFCRAICWEVTGMADRCDTYCLIFTSIHQEICQGNYFPLFSIIHTKEGTVLPGNLHPDSLLLLVFLHLRPLF